MFVKIHAYIFKVEYLQRPYCLIGLQIELLNA